MARGKSIMPVKAQVPATIVLSIIFIIILIWRLGGKKDTDEVPTVPLDSPVIGSSDTVAAPATTTGATAGSEVSLDILRKVLEDARQQEFAIPSKATSLQPLERNPFLVTSEALRELRSGEMALLARGLLEVPTETPTAEPLVAEQTPLEQQEQLLGPSREERLSMVKLSATGISGPNRTAVVNGVLVKEGDIIMGFVIQEIREGELTLRDDEGNEVELMKERTEWQSKN